ncbi:glycosyl hydrolase [Paraburkholderia sp. UYCP14C]|uniref:glycosyl hydrolase n=1 Tax=Paraburkholderia sp. UYCP14C TaxID=2511130 RepID=UPI00200718D5|nr:glycosyl hydrolase [Paraburkholderia sp. UYCP14C]
MSGEKVLEWQLIPRIILFRLFAVLTLLCGQPMSAALANTTTAMGQQLAARQPPPTGSDSDRFAMDVNCDLWSADQTALSECSKDLDLIARLGVGTVRLGASWEFMTLADGSTLDPNRVAFLKSLLNAARTRGMKILFQVGMYAPASAYHCPATRNPPTAASSRLDFCDAAFTKYLGSLMDVVLPFTADIELFNETNWSFSATDPSYGDPNGISGYILTRSKTLYSEAKSVLNTRNKLGYKTVLHTQGISYFYNSAYPNRGWKPPAGKELIQATDYIKAMGNNTKSASSPLNTTIDVVDVHPYFNGADFDILMQSFMTTVSNLAASGSKPIWLTETNNGTNLTDAGQLAAFNQLKILMNNGSVAKAFWYVVRNGAPSNGEGDTYSIYDYNRNLIRPQLAAAIQAYTATIPQGQRFLSGSYLTPIK